MIRKERFWRAILLGPVFLLATSLEAQNFVYTNNNLAAGNTVSGYAVDVNGDLSEIPGSPFTTGGLGNGAGLYASNRIIVVKNFLYASNTKNSSTDIYSSVAAFSINSSSGLLTTVPGSPFSTGSIDNASQSGVSLAATPDGKYLYAGSTGSWSVTVFTVDQTSGALSQSSSVYVGTAMSSMKVTPDGKYLVLALINLNKLAVYSIQSDGTPQVVSGSPFTPNSGSGNVVGLGANCAANLLFAGRAGSSIDVFDIASNGQLSELSNSPFSTGTVPSNQALALSPNDTVLFTTNQGQSTVSAFAVASDGSLTAVTGSPFSAGSDARYPAGIAASQDGKFLYVADSNEAVSVFGVGSGGTLTLDSYFATSLAEGVNSVAAYPPKTCSIATTMAAMLEISTGKPPSFDLNATFTLGAAADPLTLPFTLQIGSYSVTLPAGSFKTFGNGENAETDLFQGVVGSVTLKVQIVPLGQNQFQVTAEGKQIDLTSLTNPVTIGVAVGANTASVIVDAAFVDPLHGLWRTP